MVRFQNIFIFPIDFNDFMHPWGQLDIALEALFIKIMEDNGRKVKNVPQEWHIDVEWHLQCILYRLVSDPDGPINRKYTFSRHILRVQEGPEGASRTNNRAARGGLGVIWRHFGTILHALGSVSNHFRYMSVDLESLWSVFKIYSFFQ